MYTLVLFTKPFIFCGTIDMVLYNITANPNTAGLLDSALATELINADLAIDITPP